MTSSIRSLFKISPSGAGVANIVDRQTGETVGQIVKHERRMNLAGSRGLGTLVSYYSASIRNPDGTSPVFIDLRTGPFIPRAETNVQTGEPVGPVKRHRFDTREEAAVAVWACHEDEQAEAMTVLDGERLDALLEIAADTTRPDWLRNIARMHAEDEPEQQAAEAIDGAYVTNTGGGCMAAQVDLVENGGYLLITDAQEMGEPCGWHVGHYVSHDADDPFTVTYAPTMDALKHAVADARSKHVEQYGAGFIQTYGEQLTAAAAAEARTRQMVRDLGPLIEVGSADEVIGYMDAGNDAAAVEMLSTNYHLQMGAGNARKAETIEQTIEAIDYVAGERPDPTASEQTPDEDLSCSNCGEADPARCECASIEVDGAVLVSSVTAFVIEVKGRRVGVGINIDESGDPMIQLTPDGCDLDGEEPGLYYLVEKGSTGR